MNKKCLFTGGGSSGHVSVNLALIPIFIENGWDIYYIGSYSGIERRLISQNKDVQYFSIYTGKLRRYFSWQNFFDVFRVVAGVFQAFFIIKRLKPAVIFSKGGFVSFPVVIGGWLNGIPLVMHESDLSPGLANKLSMPFVTKILTTFEETKQYISSNKVQCVGPIIREFLRQGSADEGRAYCGFTKEKPILLIMGGSLGAESINLAVRANLDQLLDCFQIVHLCGRGQADASINVSGYCQFEYIDKELPDVLAMCDMVVSRAGSNAIFEFLTLRKPMVLIPLPSGSSRGD